MNLQGDQLVTNLRFHKTIRALKIDCMFYLNFFSEKLCLREKTTQTVKNTQTLFKTWKKEFKAKLKDEKLCVFVDFWAKCTPELR